MVWCGPLLFLFLFAYVSSQECQRVDLGLGALGNTIAPVTFNGIEPNTTDCDVRNDGTVVLCEAGQGVLSDRDIGPTHSVDVSNPDQVHRFFTWHQDNGSVALRYSINFKGTEFDVSYIDIYTLRLPSAGIGSPGTTTFSIFQTGTIDIVNTQSCIFSSTDNTLSRNTFTLQRTGVRFLIITYEFTNDSIDWLFISEIQVCTGDPPSSISCTDTPTTTPPPTPTAPTITLSSPPPTVTPDLTQPDSVSLTCSVVSPLTTDDYQYQWQWLKNGALLSSDTRLSITTATDTLSSSLQISGLQYSDAGEYMCRVEYIQCPATVDCNESETTRNIRLNLPVVVEMNPSDQQVSLSEGSELVLLCEVYGYPRDSSPPVWTLSGDELSDRSITTGLLSGASSVPSTERVVSQLTISNATEGDSGEYTCSVSGNSTSINVDIGEGDGSSSGADNTAMIAGVMVAILLFLVALAATVTVIVLMIWRYRKYGKLDSCSSNAIACSTCSCLTVCAGLKNVKMPMKWRWYSNKNGSLRERQYTATDLEGSELYSIVQKPPKKKVDSPPPLPALTLTETELSELMSTEGNADDLPQGNTEDSPQGNTDGSPTHQKPSRRNTTLSTYSQSGSTPTLVKLSKLKKFKLKENPIYQSADELQLDDKPDEKTDTALYALPSKSNSARNSGSFTDGPTSDPIYSEAINPSMFTKRASTVGTDDDLHPYGPVYARPVKQKTRQPLEIGEENIREIKRIGVGQFGAVILAEMCKLKSSDVNSLPENVLDENGVAMVAVKRLKPDVSDEVRQSFDKEIKFMSQLEHENIVQLLAVCTGRDNPFIVMEYMENGDLNQFLQRYQMVDDDAALYSNQIPASTLLYMAMQIASGMCYLASLNYVHRDLATRNCLVGSNFRIKISDFGMSRNLYERVYYRVHGRAMLPIRWMATESFYGRFSEKSDAWAYGVTVWEIFTLGKKQPYEELDDQEMIQDAIRGTGRRIMDKPEGCPQGVYEMMLRCWEYTAADRATFKETYESLHSVQQNS